MMKVILLVCVLAVSVNVMAKETVVWSPKKGIGKNKTWAKGATAEIKDNALVIKLTGEQWAGAGLNWQGHWPEGSGVKMADYKNIVITLKVKGSADSLNLTLRDLSLIHI